MKQNWIRIALHVSLKVYRYSVCLPYSPGVLDVGGRESKEWNFSACFFICLRTFLVPFAS